MFDSSFFTLIPGLTSKQFSQFLHQVSRCVFAARVLFFREQFFVRLHLLIFGYRIDFSWAGFLLPRAQIRFAAENFFHCRWSQRLERSSTARFSSSSPTNFLSLPRAISAADLAARFARRPLFFRFPSFGSVLVHRQLAKGSTLLLL
jgi:hypothetical protein